MVETRPHHHRATLKQTNKAFKSKHASKSALKDIAKGRIQRHSVKARSGPSANTAAQARLNRRNTAKQAQAQKRAELIESTRIFNGVDGAPRIVAVVPLCPDVDAQRAVRGLAHELDVDPSGCPETGSWRMPAARFKTSLQFINVAYRNMYAAIDACLAADYVLFVLSAETEVDNWGDVLLRTLQAHALPHVVAAVLPPEHHKKTSPPILKSLLSFVQYFVPANSRVFDLAAPSDRLSVVRALAEGRPDVRSWRDGRPWLLADDLAWIPAEDHLLDSTDDTLGTLAVTGIVRGAPLSANRLVHIPAFGDFQIEKIMSAPLPRHSKHLVKPTSTQMDTDSTPADPTIAPVLLAEPDTSSADSLVSSNDPDDLANEQTWPTEEEMRGARDDANRDSYADNENEHNGVIPAKKGAPRVIRRKNIPEGMSEYQAAWLDGESEDEDGDNVEEGADGGDQITREVDEDVGMGMDTDVGMDVESEAGTIGQKSDRTVAFRDLDPDEEEKQLSAWRLRNPSEPSATSPSEKDTRAFPDEIDTPMDQAARTRFQRFRGMRSLRTSPWDPYEALPRDYARIFAFEDFKRMERDVKREREGVEPGTRVTIYIRSVPKSASTVSTNAGAPFVLFGLLQHEHKKTVLHFVVQRNTEYEGSVRSKDPLILCIGPRRLRVNPIYSQHTPSGKGANNVHKFERYLWHGTAVVASVYGPVVYGGGRMPCALLRETENSQAPELVATGTFMNPDTTRVIAKRIVLSGHPFKVHKKTATVRYMFFNADDVNYFAPIQLHTKHGRTGHIKESLGTHGYFKAHFDGPVSQMDTVCMSLYKRVFPRWSEGWRWDASAGGGAQGRKVLNQNGDAMAVEE